jgi:hypothetical protein
MNVLRRLYHGLPLIRELRILNQQVAAARNELQALHGMISREQLLAAKVAREGPNSLHAFEHQTNSQHGEDGVLVEIFRRIGVVHRTFVEVGTGDGCENNTAFLLSQGWSGVWIDATAPVSAPGPGLRFRQAFVSRENIADLFREMNVPTEVDLCSLDVDQNTFYLWQALSHWRPRVLVAEYNASIPASVDWRVGYQAGRTWDGTMNFGASLKAFECLGRERGYALVHCDLSGANAFFVRSDLVGDKFLGPHDAETQFEPPRYPLDHRAGHGNHRLDRAADTP